MLYLIFLSSFSTQAGPRVHGPTISTKIFQSPATGHRVGNYQSSSWGEGTEPRSTVACCMYRDTPLKTSNIVCRHWLRTVKTSIRLSMKVFFHPHHNLLRTSEESTRLLKATGRCFSFLSSDWFDFQLRGETSSSSSLLDLYGSSIRLHSTFLNPLLYVPRL